jgi:hypothetical protein
MRYENSGGKVMPKIEVFTTREIATLFNVSIHTVRDWIEDPNGMRGFRIKNSLYVSADEARRYYEVKYGHTEKLGSK